MILPLLAIASVGLVVFGIIFSILLVISKKYKGKITLKYCVNKSLQFAVWVILSLQVLIQAGKSAKGELPAFLESFYTTMNIFLLEPNFMPPSCISGIPFMMETMIMSTSIIAAMVAFVVDQRVTETSVDPPNPTKKRKIAFSVLRGCHLVLMLMYPMYTNSALSLLHCETIDGNLVLTTNTKFQCFKDDLLIPDILGILTLVICSVGFPLYSWMVNRRLIRRFINHVQRFEKMDDQNVCFDETSGSFVNVGPDKNNAVNSLNSLYGQYTEKNQVVCSSKRGSFTLYRQQKNSFFLSNDMKASCFYFRHLNCLLLFAMSLLLTFSTNALLTALLDICMALVLVVAFKSTNPYIPDDAWKCNVKILSLTVVILASMLNASAYGYYTNHIDALHLVVPVLAPIVLFMAIMLFVVLFVSFWYHVAVHDIGLTRKRKASSVSGTSGFSMNPLMIESTIPTNERQSSSSTSSSSSRPMPQRSRPSRPMPKRSNVSPALQSRPIDANNRSAVEGTPKIREIEQLQKPKKSLRPIATIAKPSRHRQNRSKPTTISIQDLEKYRENGQRFASRHSVTDTFGIDMENIPTATGSDTVIPVQNARKRKSKLARYGSFVSDW
eukprot:TRINITY_DN3942_c0_g1_i5.p1 TRINITY_DN3942_c0_g1~~TRINITY_DN3942_c0_g1_i5.p1  ORF type:complete len:611 (-),score=108.48 TRINITY_DN3942_c0_g1_i5:1264-3096(-)